MKSLIKIKWFSDFKCNSYLTIMCLQILVTNFFKMSWDSIYNNKSSILWSQHTVLWHISVWKSIANPKFSVNSDLASSVSYARRVMYDQKRFVNPLSLYVFFNLKSRWKVALSLVFFSKRIRSALPSKIRVSANTQHIRYFHLTSNIWSIHSYGKRMDVHYVWYGRYSL